MVGRDWSPPAGPAVAVLAGLAAGSVDALAVVSPRYWVAGLPIATAGALPSSHRG